MKQTHCESERYESEHCESGRYQSKHSESGHYESERYESGLEMLRQIDGTGGENVIRSLEDIAPDIGRQIIELSLIHI